MRHLRAKQGRKTLNYFRIAFGVAPPYSVLLDGNFIHAATSHKIDIVSRVRKHLGGEKFTFFVPACVVAELRSLGTPVEAALEFAQAHCEVLSDEVKGAASPTDAIRAIIGESNTKRFIVATQEEALRDHLRSLPTGVPLMHIQRTVLLLEAPSAAARRTSRKDESAKLRGEESKEFAMAKKVLLEERAEKRRIDGSSSTVPKKERAQGPNPLSCMKKKTAKKAAIPNVAGSALGSADSQGKKTRRGKKAKLQSDI
jgi:U3 small nucleolar RNA-associated protein 23